MERVAHGIWTIVKIGSVLLFFVMYLYVGRSNLPPNKGDAAKKVGTHWPLEPP